MKFFCLLLLISLSRISSLAQCTSSRYADTIFHAVTVTSGTSFGTAQPYLGLPQNLKLDFYEPTGDTLTARPLIVYAFGGGFLIGTRNQPPIPAYCTYFAQCGYAVAAIDYRIGFNTLDGNSCERAVYRAAQDLRAAVRYLAQRYSQYRIDTTAIFLTGSSAGCFSGLHSCFMEQNEVPSSAHGTLLEPSDLGCYDCSGNSDNNSTMPKIRGIINHWGALLDTIYIRPTAKDKVPVISFHGDGDNIVPYVYGHPFSYPVFPNVYGAVPIHKRLQSVGIRNELHTLYGKGHEPWLLDPALKDTCYRYTRPFLLSILKPHPLVITGDTALCANTRATYSVPLRAGSHYCWQVQGGAIVTNSNDQITVLWTSTGYQSLRVQELSRNEVNGDGYSLTVKVIPPPQASFGVVVNHTVVSVVDSSKGAVSWAYAFGDGGTATAPVYSHDYHSQGIYTIQLAVSNGYCADTTYLSITTDSCPVAAIHHYQLGDTLYLSADTSNGVLYQWHYGDGDSAIGIATAHSYTNSQNYLISLTVTSVKGCKTSTSAVIAYQRNLGLENAPEALPAMYPNPAREQLFINVNDATITIYNELGQVVLKRFIARSEAIDIDNFNVGLYLVKINDRNNTTNYELIIY